MKKSGYDLLKFSLPVCILLSIIFVSFGTIDRAQAAFSITPEVKLTASDPEVNDYFGYSVAISGDTAVVGASNKTGHTGAAYIYVRSNSAWSQQAKLSPTDLALNDYFGYSVAISGDTAVVGAYYKSGGIGAAYIFVRSGTIWSQQAKLNASDAAAVDYFGYAVAISGDTAVVGACYKNGQTGAAYIFMRSGSGWSQQAKLTASDAAVGASFGCSVSVSGDTALIGAFGNNSFTGAAYIFVRSGAAWSQQAKLTASDTTTFGCSVAISGDTAVVGAEGKNVFTGEAYVFIRTGTSWSQQARLTASDGATFDYFGHAVAINGDTAVVGAYYKNGGAGAAYPFMRSGSSWNQLAKLTASDAAAGANFGCSVSLSGNTALVGAFGKDPAGAAYIYINILPPGVSTDAAASVTSTSATINGTLTNMGTAASVNVSFEYGTTTAYGLSTPVQTMTATGNFNASITGLTPGMTYHFRARADGGVNGMTTGPDLTFSTTPTSVQYTLTIKISGGGTATGAGTYSLGTVVSINAAPLPVWQFTGWSGDAVANANSASTTIAMNGNKVITANFSLIPPPTPTLTTATAPSVSTAAASVTSTSATINGTLTNLGTAVSVNVSFEYGTTAAYGVSTPVQVMTTTGNFNASVTGLTPGMTYHFRAMADGGVNGMATGPDLTFITSTTPLTVSTAISSITASPSTLSGSLTAVSLTPGPTPASTKAGTSIPYYIWLMLMMVGAMIVAGAVIVIRKKTTPRRTIKPKSGVAVSPLSGSETKDPDYWDILIELVKLKDQGVITKEEYESKKAELLQKIGKKK